MERFASNLTGKLLRQGYIDADQVEWCCYAIMHRCMNAISFLLLVIVGSMFVDWRAAVLFTISFRFLRVRTGGYHAKKPYTCLLTSLSVQIIALFTAQRIYSPFVFWTIALIAVCLILKLAPANNAAIHLTQKEMAALRPAIGGRILIVFIGGGVLLLLNDMIWGSSIIVALAADAVLLVLSVIGLGVQ